MMSCPENVWRIRADCQEAINQLSDYYLKTRCKDIELAGLKYFDTLAHSIVDACDPDNPGGYSPQENTNLYNAVKQAAEGGLPMGLIKSALDLARQGYESIPGLISIGRSLKLREDNRPHAYILWPQNAVESALTHRDLSAGNAGNVNVMSLWDMTAEYIWDGCDVTVIFAEDFPADVKDPVILHIPDYLTRDKTLDIEHLRETVRTKIKEDAKNYTLTGLGTLLRMIQGSTINSAGHVAAGFSTCITAVILSETLRFESNMSSSQEAKNNVHEWYNHNANLFHTGIKKLPVLDPVVVPDTLQKILQSALAELKAAIKSGHVRYIPQVHISRDAASDLDPFFTESETQESLNSLALLQGSLTGHAQCGLSVSQHTTVDDIQDILTEAWGMGIKELNVHRIQSGWDAAIIPSDIYGTK